MKKMRQLLSILFILVLIFSSLPSTFATENQNEIDLVDADASSYTKSLFTYLQRISGEQVLFGHQHATDEGLTITGSGTRPGSIQSEVKNSVGDYPAIFGWDTLSLDGDEKPGSSENTDAQNRENLIKSMKAAHELGGIVALSMHPPNFATGGRYNDTSSKSAVADILPGGPANDKFNAWLDNLAAFANNLKDDNGELIPVIFRPFHEQNGGWFWWGAQTTTTSEYKEVYRYLVEYLRDKKGVSNLLYAFSPNGPFNGNEEDYLKTYPGDDYVDIIGLDQYDNQENPGSDSFISKLVNDLAMISRIAEQKGKISAFSEYGYSPQGMKTTGNGDLKWFTKILNAIKSDPDASKVSYMQTWANFALGGNLFVPYKGYENAPEGGPDHELLPDFIDFYDDSYSAFLNEVGEIYTGEEVATADESSFMHVVTPTDNIEVKTNTTTIRARVLNDNPAKVVYTVAGSDEEFPMSLDEEGFYYTADWSPSAAINGGTTDITVKVYDNANNIIHEQTVTVIVKVSEISMKNYTFDDGIEGVQNNGAYPESIKTSFEHATLNDNGMLKINAMNLEQGQTWQELKLELTDLSEVNLPAVKRVTFDAFVPTSAKTDNASLLGIAMLPQDWGTKYGESTTGKQFVDLETMTIDGVEYAKYSASIDLNDPAKSEAATGLAISLIGKELNLSNGAVYVDNIQLLSVFAEAPKDPSLVDDFESYLGSDASLNTKFVPANGNVSISLSGSNKNSGTYGLKYDYTLGGAGDYTGVTKTLNNLDWSEYNKLQLWLDSDGQAQKLVIQIQIGGISFEAYPSLEADHAGIVEIPFSDFTPAPWDTANAGKVITKENLKNVTQFSLYINAQDNLAVPVNSTLFFDDLRVINDGTGGVPNGGDGPGSMPEKPGVLYDFEEDTQGWAIESNEANAAKAQVTDEEAAHGSKSLASTFDPSGTAGFEFAKVQAVDLSAISSISAKVKLSEGTAANARLYIKTGSEWTWIDSGIVTVDDSEFKTLTIPLKGIANVSSVNAIGIKIEPTSGTGTATAYVDEITLHGDGEESGPEEPGTEPEEPGTDPGVEPGPEEPGTEPGTEGSGELPKKEIVDSIEDLELVEKVYVLNKFAKKFTISKEVLSQLDKNTSIQLSNGKVRVKIPVSVLPSDADIELTIGDNIADSIDIDNATPVSEVYDFLLTADGESINTFDEPITLTFLVDSSLVDNKNNLHVLYIDEDGTEEVINKGFVYNEKIGEASADVSHFSTFGVFELADEPVPTSPNTENPTTEKTVSASPVQDNEKGKSGNELPSTATSQYNWLVLGVIVLAAGIAFLLIRKRKALNE